MAGEIQRWRRYIVRDSEPMEKTPTGIWYKREDADAWHLADKTAALEAQAKVHKKALTGIALQQEEYWSKQCARIRSEHAADLEALRGAGEPVLRPSLLRFALEMERKLKDNDHKPGWEDDDNNDLFERILDEARELRDAIENSVPLPTRVIEEAVDVANFAMMIADNAGLRAAADLEALRGEGEGALMTFRQALTNLINRHGMEGMSNTPDFILAMFIDNCLETWNGAIRHRDEWQRQHKGATDA